MKNEYKVQKNNQEIGEFTSIKKKQRNLMKTQNSKQTSIKIINTH